MFVRPIAGGHDVLDPHSKQPIPRAGMEVDGSAYWLRRLRDGDLEEFTPEPAEGSDRAKDGVKPETPAAEPEAQS